MIRDQPPESEERDIASPDADDGWSGSQDASSEEEQDHTSQDSDDEASKGLDELEDSTDNDSTKWHSDEREMVKGCPKLKRKRSPSRDDTEEQTSRQDKHHRQNPAYGKVEKSDYQRLEHSQEASPDSPDHPLSIQGTLTGSRTADRHLEQLVRHSWRHDG